MYYWKIWRDTRVRFFTVLILGLCFGWLTVWTRLSYDLSRSGFVLGQALPPAIAIREWARGTVGAMGSGGVMLWFIGLMVGSSGLGEEIERGTAPFLLTRPRSRGYFLWSFWLACGVELLAFTSIMMLAGYATLFYYTRHTGPWNFLLIAPILMITGLLAVGLAQFLVTLSRSGKYALAGSFTFTICYVTAATLLKMYEVVNLPSPVSMYSLSFTAALAGTMLIWLAAALGFIALAHLIVTRMEV